MGDLRTAGSRRLASALLCLGLALAAPARAEAPEPLPVAPAIALGGEDDRPTTAWKEFCHRLPAECEVNTAEPELLTLTAESWALIKRINLQVNETIQQVTDQKHWGVNDRWDYPDDGKGDCEDIQLLKRRLLTEAGLPRRAMRMTVVIDRRDAGHAVLTVRTDRGDFILDNETDLVLPWNKTGYDFVKREGSDGLAWVALGGGEPNRIVVASRSVSGAGGPAAGAPTAQPIR
ncbi:transglutaminase-like cysteine peptidase [Enterovirga aerilata]|uniref:Transglutaminase-like cysteine peptidase n=1 Tax=Enterovirga aerilata TaxID=2730920 RepID=A0A849HTY1_9HYPH|nr:transglutaminase-like cysteine peptidase [Enterovirga sp. DB1703]NNM70956.1 transglutaminase-like cysteine peptidase [Enterovirga sp. DB1703]